MPALFRTNPERIQDLLSEIDNGRLVLPDFQRDFIWKPEQTARLLASVIARYPAGSLLTWQPHPIAIGTRLVKGAPDRPVQEPIRIILDGQQRLTGLYRALNAKTDETYFLDLKQLLDPATFSLREREDVSWDLAVVRRESTAAERNAHTRDNTLPEYRTLVWQNAHLMFPIGRANFDDWMDGVIEACSSDEEKDRRRGVLRQGIRDGYLAELKNYQFPVIALTDEAGIAAVCTVFERLNTNAVKLGPFEILSAKFYKDDVNLRQLWATAQDDPQNVLGHLGQNKDQTGFAIDPYLILQIISARTHNSPQQKAVLNELTATDITNEWSRVVLATKRVIEWLRDSCGVIHRELLPYQAVLIPMTGAWLARDMLPGPRQAAALLKIEQFFWASVFTMNYDQGGASQAERDFRDLVAWVNTDGAAKPEALASLRIKADDLFTATMSKTALKRGCMALTIRAGIAAGAKDFHTGLPLTPQVYIDKKMNSHHLYPRARLEDTDPSTGIAAGGYSTELILNRAIIDADTNSDIRAKKPSVYVRVMRDGGGDVDSLLGSHLIDSAALEADDYPAFIRQRLADFIAKIEEVTGVKVVPLTTTEAAGTVLEPEDEEEGL